MKNQIQIASEVKNSSRTSTLVHEMHKNQTGKVSFVIALFATFLFSTVDISAQMTEGDVATGVKGGVIPIGAVVPSIGGQAQYSIGHS